MTSWRLRLLLSFFLIFSLLVVARLFYWQVLHRESLLIQAEALHTMVNQIEAPRGKIFSADGFPLAASQEAFLVYASLSDLKEKPEKIASQLNEVFLPEGGEEEKESLEEQLKARLSSTDLFWVALRRGVDRQVKEEIENLEIEGIGFEPMEKRVYPEGSMSAHLLGFVGQDSSGKDKGYFGLEGYYDRELTGRPGTLRLERDAQGRPILIGERIENPPMPGRDLVLYLDRGIQYLVEEKLRKGIERYGAKAGSVVVLEPQSGGVLAMASFPNFVPANYAQTDVRLFPNPVVAESFEPGSIFKIVVMSAALNDGVVKPEDKCGECGGPRKIDKYVIKTWDEEYYPDSSMTEVIQHSDNVGMVWVTEKLGVERLYDYLVSFGFGAETEVDLEGEGIPALRAKNEWNVVDLAVVGFGQGIAVTPLQMVRAAGVIANGGELVEPHVIKTIETEEREIEIKPKILRRVISSATAKVVTEMMVNAVEKGEAQWAKPQGFRIAGKTGTSQIPIAGHYDEEKTIASFVGFAPADNPQFVMLVTLKEPTSSPWGAETAAPLWFDIAKELFVYWGIPPQK
jgi:cell division protein FtsI/penicillin-binding protein 2